MNAGRRETATQARHVLDDLIRQRQGLIGHASEAGLLEANRLGIIYWQSQLDRARSAE